MKICIFPGKVLSTPPLCLTNCLLLRISVSPYKDLQRRNKNFKTMFDFNACYIYVKWRVCKLTPVFIEQTTN